MKLLYVVAVVLILYLSGGTQPEPLVAAATSAYAEPIAVSPVESSPSCVFCELVDAGLHGSGYWMAEYNTRHCEENDDECRDCDDETWYKELWSPVYGTLLSGIVSGTCQQGSFIFWDEFDPCLTADECLPISALDLSNIAIMIAAVVRSENSRALVGLLGEGFQGATIRYNQGVLSISSCSGESLLRVSVDGVALKALSWHAELASGE